MALPENVVWAAQPGAQHAFLSVPYVIQEVLLEGTRGGGKTDSIAMDFCREVGTGMGPEWSGYLFKRTNPELRDVKEKIVKFLPRMFPGVKFVKSPYFEVIFPEGEKLMLRHMGRDEDYLDVHGSSVTWIGWEELTNWATPTLFLKCKSLLRSSHPIAAMKKRIRATSNPGGPGHNWVRARYNLPAMRGKVISGNDTDVAKRWMQSDQMNEGIKTSSLRMAIFSDIRENKVFLDSDPGYLDGLKQDAESEAQYRAWVYGDWNIVSGGMFDDVWRQDVHWIKPFNIPPNWRVDRSFDWGESKPFSLGWWAQSDGSDVQLKSGRWVSTVPGDLFRIAEWYGWTGQPNVGLKLTSTEIAQGALEVELAHGIYGRCQPGPADTGIFSGFDGKASIAQEMAKPIRRPNGRQYRGITFTEARKGPNSRIPGWSLMRKALKNAIRLDSRPREKPGLFAFDICEQFARTVPVLGRDIKKPDDVDTEAEDHIADECRYRVINVGSGVTSGLTSSIF